jgi:tight adherence protein C
MDRATEIFDSLGIAPEALVLLGLGLGVLILVFGASGVLAGQGPEARRMHAVSLKRGYNADFDLIRGEDNDPRGLLKAFVPSSRSERTQIAKTLRQAGIQGRHAVRSFYAFRTLLGLALPVLFILAMALPPEMQNATGIDRYVGGLSWATALQGVTVLMVAGFYGPWVWLRARIRARRQAITYSLPNALDLLQVSVEAGLGFDAAMVRVSHELAGVAPEISQEFMMLQLEIQAGKERQPAFLDMAERTGVDEVAAFANVILQANQFGTSVSSALSTFASDMRLDRELRAQEKANRLPVQMSAVMALFMMPVLLMICLTPMLIRWLTMFG